jgi:putative ubiquitin-RnfH superfamily antitoxin RatB of RatAB toxin-antitoxin module
MHQINVSVAYATAEKQWVHKTCLSRGSNAYDLIENSGFMVLIEALAEQSIDALDLGVFAQKVSHDYLLQEGDRLEIYRPLTADPKEVRRQLALMGKTMGQK